MVRHLAAIAALAVGLSGCGKFWGEAPPPPGRVQLAASSNGCGNAQEILEGEDGRSSEVFECWSKEVEKLFSQVNGQVPESLSVEEIHVLIERHVLDLGIPVDAAKAKIAPAFELFGIKGRLTRARMLEWLEYARSNRGLLRKMYTKFAVNSGSRLETDDVTTALTAARAFLSTAKWENGFTAARAVSDVDSLVGLPKDTQEKILVASELATLDGPDFVPELDARLDWSLKNADRLLRARDAIGADRLADAEVPGILSVARDLVSALHWDPARVDLAWLLDRANRLAGLSAATDLKIRVGGELLSLDGSGFVPGLLARLDWALANSDALRHAKAVLSSDDRLPDAEIPRLAATLRDVLVSMGWDDARVDLGWVLDRVLKIATLPADAVNQLQGWNRFLGLEGPGFRPRLLARIDWALKNSDDIRYIYRSLSIEKKKLNDIGMPRFFAFSRDFIDELRWPEGMRLVELNPLMALIFGIDAPSMELVTAAERVAGLAVGSPADSGDIRLKIRERLDFAAKHWDEMAELPKRMAPEQLLRGPRGKQDLELLRQFAVLAKGADGLDESAFLDAIGTLTELTPHDRAQIEAVRDLLSIGGKDFRDRIDARVKYIEAHFSDIQWMYEKFATGFKPFKYAELQRALSIAGQLLGQARWSLPPEQLARKLIVLLGITDADALKAANPASRVGLNVLGFVCPAVTNLELWQATELATCLTTVPKAFASGAAWADLHFNPVTRVPTQAALESAKKSLNALDDAASRWFAQSKLKPIRTRGLLDLAEALGAHPPKDFIESLAILEKFGGKSTREKIDPTAMSYVAHVFHNFRSDVLDGLPVFARAWSQGACREKKPKSYEQCTPLDLDRENGAIAMALQVKNLRFASDVAPFNGERFTKIMLFRALAGQLIRVFDTDGDGLVVSTKNGSNEVMDMMSVGVMTYDVFSRFMDNVVRKLDGKPISQTDAPFSFGNYDLRGLSRAVSLFATDLLVSRPKEESDGLFRNIGKALKSLGDIAPESATFLDRQGITAAIDLIDTLSYLREDYVKLVSARALEDMVSEDLGTQVRVSRKRALEVLPQFLKHNFPRSAASCEEWGFEKSCGIILDEVLPAADDQGTISAGDLDAVSFITAGMESLLDSCDDNENGTLELSTFWTADELSCAVKKGSDAAARLISAKIIHTDSGSLIHTALSLAKLHELTRAFAKVALIDGTSKFVILTPARVPVEIITTAVRRKKEKATLGSMFSFVSDIAAPDRHRH